MAQRQGRSELDPIKEIAGASVYAKQKMRMSEIIEQFNTLFGGDATDSDQLSYATTLAEKTLESELLQKQSLDVRAHIGMNAGEATVKIDTR